MIHISLFGNIKSFSRNAELASYDCWENWFLRLDQEIAEENSLEEWFSKMEKTLAEDKE